MSFFNKDKIQEAKIAEQSSVPAPKCTLLIVDDEKANLDFLYELLETEYDLLTARDGQEALELVQNHEDPKKIRLIITDQRMPNLTGIEFLKLTIPIIPRSIRMILTGFTDVGAIIDSINEGQIYKFITKPFDPKDMLLTVQRALEAYDLEDQNLKLIDELTTLNASLEQKVRERTESLENEHARLKKTQTQLVHAEKMAGLGTLVAGAAHELNNPNNFIAGGVQNLHASMQDFQAFIVNLLDVQEGGDSLAGVFEAKLNPMIESINVISNGSKRIDAIVKGLRTFSRLDEAAYKEVDIVENLRSAIVLVQANYRDQVEIVEDFQFAPRLLCWSAELNQAFANILINSCKAIVAKQQSGGELPGRLTISTARVDDSLEIRFEDTGCGMPESVQDRMFEPFFTTREAGQGTGLGLAIVFGVIEKHKGSIDVQSQEGVGTTTVLRLPLAQELH